MNSSLSVPGESSYAARVGLRQLSWHGGRVYLNGRAAEAPRRLDPGGRRRATATR